MYMLKQIPRYILGLIFVVFGLNFIFGFFPTPQPTEAGLNYLSALMATGYFFPLLKATEITCGLLLLAGFFVPLALVILAPIVINILLYHLYLDPAGLPLALLITACFLFEASRHCRVWKCLSVCRGSCCDSTKSCSAPYESEKESCCK